MSAVAGIGSELYSSRVVPDKLAQKRANKMAHHLVMKTEAVQAWTVLPTDEGRNTAIVFRVQMGTAAFSFSPDDFGRFAGEVISQASHLAEGHAAAATPQSANAIPIDSLSIEPHPDDQSSALLAIDAGKLQLLFAADVKLLLDACKQFLGQWREHRGPHRDAHQIAKGLLRP